MGRRRGRSAPPVVRGRAPRARRLQPRRPLPQPSASRFLHYDRTGDRTSYEDPYFERRRWLSAFALAECFEREGRYLDIAWSVCEATTWLLLAHIPERERTAGLPAERPPSEERYLELFAARTALVLAELDRLLGDQLHPALRERLRTEIDRRVLTLYETTDDWGWQVPPAGNHNAVCNVSVAVAALDVLTDPDRQARIVKQATKNLQYYLADFDADGCMPEGVLYWDFGISHFATLATELAARTGGEFSLFEFPVFDAIARFPLRAELSPRRTVAFSDTEEHTRLTPHAACPVGLACDVPALAARGCERMADRESVFAQHSDALPELLRGLVWSRRVPNDWSSTTPPARRTYFSGHEWWLARAAPDDPEGLVVAAKAGHNDEPHNHNDCGSFVIHANRESSLCDLGVPAYDAGYFGAERYEYLTARSLGHSVPYINGREQAAGDEYAARVLDRQVGEQRDAVEMDLTACYPDAAGLDRLHRTIALDRDPARSVGGRVTVTDEVAFDADTSGTANAEDDPTWVSVLVSYFPIEATDEGLLVTGDRGHTRVGVASEPAGATVRTEHLPNAVDVSDRDTLDIDARDVWRARISPPPADRSTVEMTIEPEPTHRDTS